MRLKLETLPMVVGASANLYIRDVLKIYVESLIKDSIQQS